MKQCFAYIRVSTVKQGEGVSLEAQKDAIEVYARRNKIKVSRWVEEKETAAKSGRPKFNKMMTDLKRGRAEGVIFHKIDRSARNFSDWAKIGDLSEAGVDVMFATETLDFSSRGGRLTADIQAVIAADYIRNLREESIKGQRARLKQGLYPFKAPLGYLDTGRGRPKSIDPIKGPLVRDLFEAYASGEYSLHSLVPEARKMGLKNSVGGKLGKTTIEKILRNPFYAGIITLRSNEAVYNGVHEPLISMELFERVRDIRLERDNKKSTRHNHLFRGLLRCGLCNGAMIPERQKGHVYYRCHLRTCPTTTVRQGVVDQSVVDLLSQYRLSERNFAALRRAFRAWIKTRNEGSLGQVAEFELNKLAERLTRLTDKFVDDLIDSTTFERRKKEIIIDQRKWQGVLRRTSNLAVKLRRADKFLELSKSLYSQYQIASDAEKRQILKSSTSNRLVRGRKLELEPSDWLSSLLEMTDFEQCDPCRPTSRTFELFFDAFESSYAEISIIVQ